MDNKVKKSEFATYVAEVKKEYKYMLKFALNEMPDSFIDAIEEGLKKYDLKAASPFKKTPIQESPLDFPNVRNTSVYICDITLNYPGSLDFLRTYLSNVTGISQQQIAVYSSEDPRKIETDLYLDRRSPEFKEKYKTALGNDYPDDVDQSDFVGPEYNIKFLQELEKVRKERKNNKVINSLNPEETIDHSMLPDGYHDFNKDITNDTVGFFGRVKNTNVFNTGVL